MTDLTHTILELDNLNLILDNLKLGIIVHTPERIIKVFNKEAERITGYFRDEVLDKDCHMVFQEPFCGGKCSFCDNTSPQLPFGSKEYPLSIITKDGATKHLEMTVSAIFDRGSEFKGVLASFRDITESFNLSLKAEKLSSFAGMIGKAKVMQQIFTQIRDVALYNYPVHISGETGTGKEAVIFADRLRPDIVIMDISLPDIDGIEAAKEILKRHRSCGIILLSMYEMSELLDMILEMGIKGYVLKNDAYEDLLYAIKAVADGKVFISSSLQHKKTAVSHPPQTFSSKEVLTPREKEILHLIAEGLTSKQIAQKLFISVKTVETHRARIMEKLGCKNIAALVKTAIRLGLISLY